MSRGVRTAAFAAMLAAACSSGASTERRGDQAYRDGRYADALAIYQEAVSHDPAGRLWAKVGGAALRAGKLDTAIDAYLRLAGEDPTRGDEAAEGLAAAADSAERAGDGRILQLAVSGLDMVSPERISGQAALALARRPESNPADLVRLMPRALAAASHPRSVDSLLGLYAAGLRETAGCEAAVPLYRAVVRRSREPALVDAANQHMADCIAPWLSSPSVADSTVDSMGVP